jgi:hypothetical protein
MTVLDRLLEIGLKCPCCKGEVYISRLETVDYRVRCAMCRCRGDLSHNEINAITSWLILTGGPVPGEIPPPDDWGRWCLVVDTWIFGGFTSFVVRPKSWMFWPSERTPEIITPWLGMEVER